LSGYLNVVDVLLLHGVPVGVEDNRGRTPVYYARKYRNELVARRLIEHGASMSDAAAKSSEAAVDIGRRLESGEAVAWYLNHRGWAVKTQNHVLVFDAEEFDVTRPTEPSLGNGFITLAEIADQKVIALYTAYHGEIGEPAYVHEIEDSLGTVTYVHNAGDRWRGSESTVYLSPGGETRVGDVEIAAMAVTETMSSLGYLVKVDGVVIYYAGFRAEDPEKFRQDLEVLSHHTDGVDLAFLPMVEPDEQENDVAYFLERIKPAVWLVLDPNRREHLFAAMGHKVEEWGFDCEVFAAENPGDRFVYAGR
jgi:L-ascorbate metabolism protein UlaG (beta-lactamase superfamily)